MSSKFNNDSDSATSVLAGTLQHWRSNKDTLHILSHAEDDLQLIKDLVFTNRQYTNDTIHNVRKYIHFMAAHIPTGNVIQEQQDTQRTEYIHVTATYIPTGYMINVQQDRHTTYGNIYMTNRQHTYRHAIWSTYGNISTNRQHNYPSCNMFNERQYIHQQAMYLPTGNVFNARQFIDQQAVCHRQAMCVWRMATYPKSLDVCTVRQYMPLRTVYLPTDYMCSKRKYLKHGARVNWERTACAHTVHKHKHNNGMSHCGKMYVTALDIYDDIAAPVGNGCSLMMMMPWWWWWWSWSWWLWWWWWWLGLPEDTTQTITNVQEPRSATIDITDHIPN